jgi:hypothetical protein
MDDAIEDGWTPSFYGGETEHEFDCPGCAENSLREGEDRGMEVKQAYRGKLRYMDERGDENRREHLLICIALLENEIGKLN